MGVKAPPQGFGLLKTEKTRVLRHKILYDRNDRRLFYVEDQVARMLSESDVIGAYYVKNGIAWFDGRAGEKLRGLYRRALEMLTSPAPME